jgi:hypothetical protein
VEVLLEVAFDQEVGDDGLGQRLVAGKVARRLPVLESV